MKILSTCPICLNKIKGRLSIKNGRVFLNKTCDKHGNFLFPYVWNVFKVYKFLHSIPFKISYPNGIIVDITTKCNLSCSFCFGINTYKKLEEKSKSEIIKLIRNARKKIPFSIVYLFGGEPTLRKDIFSIIKSIKKMKLEVGLFTNGLKLINLRYVKKLKKAGLDYVTLSFDSLNDKVYEKIRGKKCLAEKTLAIKNLKKNKISTSLFVVVLKGLNDKEIGKIVEFASRYENIKNIYISTLTLEGKYLNSLKPISNCERLALIKKQLKVKDEDFFLSTMFDHYIVNILGILTKKPIKHLSFLCDLGCYFYSLNSRPIPLTRIINLEYLLKILDKNFYGKNFYLKFFLLGLISFCYNNITKYKGIFIYFLLVSFISILKNFLGIPIKNPFKKVLRVIITQFQDRNNLDFKTFEACNLFSICSDGSLRPFCEKIIYKL
ncbi:MAG: radical SAM protein [Candidatus Aenigmatarchaeota archaeon]